MKTTKRLFLRAIFAIFVLSIVFVPFATEVKAGSLTNASDTLSEIFQTQLAANAMNGDTTISVINGTGIALSDVLFVTADGTVYEERTVSATPTSNTISVDAITYDWTSGTGIDVTVLTGITHDFSFDTSTTAKIDTIRFTYDANAQTDGGSFSGVTFANISGVTSGGSHVTNQSSYTDFDADNSSISAGTTIQMDLQAVRNPNGVTATSYAITVQTIDDIGSVIDSVDIYFGVDTGVLVKGSVDSILTFTIADDGSTNNPSDSNETIQLHILDTATSDNATTGEGVDGNLLTVTTNATNGYTITVQDTAVGLVNSNYAGGARSSGASDNGIDDISGGPTTWPVGSEAYAYYVAGSFDSDGTGNAYTAFTASPATIKTTTAPVSNETTYVTVRAQRAATTPAGDYNDIITYIITPNF